MKHLIKFLRDETFFNHLQFLLEALVIFRDTSVQRKINLTNSHHFIHSILKARVRVTIRTALPHTEENAITGGSSKRHSTERPIRSNDIRLNGVRPNVIRTNG